VSEARRWGGDNKLRRGGEVSMTLTNAVRCHHYQCSGLFSPWIPTHISPRTSYVSGRRAQLPPHPLTLTFHPRCR